MRKIKGAKRKTEENLRKNGFSGVKISSIKVITLNAKKFEITKGK